MTIAATGGAATARSGKMSAIASKRTAAARCTANSGDDSKTTGSNVMPDIDHSGSSRACTATATSAARRNGVLSAMTKKRRSAFAGHSVSLIALRLGHVTKALSTIAGAI